MADKGKIEVTVIYKSGATMVFRTDEVTVKRSRTTGELTEFAWGNAEPKPLFANLDEIAAVWTKHL